MTSAHLQTIARALGYPRLSVQVPGRRWPIPIEPTSEGWERFVAWFERDPGALESAWHELIEWECEVRADLLTVETSDAS